MRQLIEALEPLPDPRSIRNQRHQFSSIICIGILGAISGIDSFSGLSDFTECHFDCLSEIIELPNGVPSHDTFRRVFDLLDTELFHQCFMQFTDELSQSAHNVIAIDGKRVRNSDKAHPLHLVSAWCEANQVALAQCKVPHGHNELIAIPELLSLLDLSGAVITIDAMGCRRNISKQIIDGDGDYVLALKQNQGSLLEDAKPYFEDLKRFDGYSWHEVNKGHGRIEERTCYVTDQIDFLADHKWPKLTSIAMVVSKRTIKDKTTEERRYYISSLTPDAERICKAARSHWGIENKLHWRLDVTYNEDKACIRNENAAENMALLRKWALNILSKHKGKSSTKSLQRKASMSFKFLMETVIKAFHA